MAPISIAPDAPFFVVLNPGSGHGDAGDTRGAIERAFAESGRTLYLHLVPPGKSPAALAQRVVDQAGSCGGVVVAAGGDGTINAVAQAVLGSGCPFGVLPQGTFNYFSRTHGIPFDTAEATRVLLTARAHPVQAGLINDKVFLVNASLGIYPQLLQDREAYKQQFGRSRPVALASGLMTLLREHRQLRLRIEQRRAGVDEVNDVRTPTLFVGNNRLQLEQIGIPEAPLLEQGLLAAITLKPVGTLAMLGLLLRGALGRLGEADTVDSFASRRITVWPALPYGTRRIKVATDGEIVWLQAPLEFRVAPTPLYLIKPEPQPEPAEVVATAVAGAPP